MLHTSSYMVGLDSHDFDLDGDMSQVSAFLSGGGDEYAFLTSLLPPMDDCEYKLLGDEGLDIENHSNLDSSLFISPFQLPDEKADNTVCLILGEGPADNQSVATKEHQADACLIKAEGQVDSCLIKAEVQADECRMKAEGYAGDSLSLEEVTADDPLIKAEDTTEYEVNDDSHVVEASPALAEGDSHSELCDDSHVSPSTPPASGFVLKNDSELDVPPKLSLYTDCVGASESMLDITETCREDPLPIPSLFSRSMSNYPSTPQTPGPRSLFPGSAMARIGQQFQQPHRTYQTQGPHSAPAKSGYSLFSPSTVGTRRSYEDDDEAWTPSRKKTKVEPESIQYTPEGDTMIRVGRRHYKLSDTQLVLLKLMLSFDFPKEDEYVPNFKAKRFVSEPLGIDPEDIERTPEGDRIVRSYGVPFDTIKSRESFFLIPPLESYTKDGVSYLGAEPTETLYDPVFIRRLPTDDDNHGWCEVCGRWLQLRNHTYAHHFKSVHGISQRTKSTVNLPLVVRGKPEEGKKMQGYCGVCQCWIDLHHRRNGQRWQTWYIHQFQIHHKDHAPNEVQRPAPPKKSHVSHLFSGYLT